MALSTHLKVFFLLGFASLFFLECESLPCNDSAVCAPSVDGNGDCTLTCVCDNVGEFNRTYTCNHNTAAVLARAILITNSSAIGNATVYLRNSVDATFPILPVPPGGFNGSSIDITGPTTGVSAITSAFANFLFDTTGTVNIDLVSVRCKPSIALSGTMLYWNVSEGGNSMLNFSVFNGANSTATGSSTNKTSFTPNPVCGSGAYFVRASLNEVSCPEDSDTVTITFSSPPANPTQLGATAAFINASAADVSPVWVQGTFGPCPASNATYTVQVDSGNATRVVVLHAADVDVAGDTVRPTAPIALIGALDLTSLKFTVTISSGGGSSSAVAASVVVPPFPVTGLVLQNPVLATSKSLNVSAISWQQPSFSGFVPFTDLSYNISASGAFASSVILTNVSYTVVGGVVTPTVSIDLTSASDIPTNMALIINVAAFNAIGSSSLVSTTVVFAPSAVSSITTGAVSLPSPTELSLSSTSWMEPANPGFVPEADISYVASVTGSFNASLILTSVNFSVAAGVVTPHGSLNFSSPAAIATGLPLDFSIAASNSKGQSGSVAVSIVAPPSAVTSLLFSSGILSSPTTLEIISSWHAPAFTGFVPEAEISYNVSVAGAFSSELLLTSNNFTDVGGVITPKSALVFSAPSAIATNTPLTLHVIASNSKGNSPVTIINVELPPSAPGVPNASNVTHDATSINTGLSWPEPSSFGFHPATGISYVVNVSSASASISHTLLEGQYLVTGGIVSPNSFLTFNFTTGLKTALAYSVHIAAAINSLVSAPSAGVALLTTPSAPSNLNVVTAWRSDAKAVTVTATFLLPDDQGFSPAGDLVFLATLSSGDAPLTATPLSFNVVGSTVTANFTFTSPTTFVTDVAYTLSVKAGNSKAQFSPSTSEVSVSYAPSTPAFLAITVTNHTFTEATVNASWSLPTDQGFQPLAALTFNLTVTSGAYTHTITLANVASVGGIVSTPPIQFLNPAGFATNNAVTVDVVARNSAGASGPKSVQIYAQPSAPASIVVDGAVIVTSQQLNVSASWPLPADQGYTPADQLTFSATIDGGNFNQTIPATSITFDGSNFHAVGLLFTNPDSFSEATSYAISVVAKNPRYSSGTSPSKTIIATPSPPTSVAVVWHRTSAPDSIVLTVVNFTMPASFGFDTLGDLTFSVQVLASGFVASQNFTNGTYSINAGVATLSSAVTFASAGALQTDIVYHVYITTFNSQRQSPLSNLVQLQYAPSTPPAVHVVNVAHPGADSFSSLNVSLSWTQPTDLGFTVPADMTYAITVSTSTSSFQHTVTLIPGDYTVENTTVTPRNVLIFSSGAPLLRNESYSINVSAANSKGVSAASPSVPVEYAPSAPRSITVTSVAHADDRSIQVALHWLEPADMGLSGFETMGYTLTVVGTETVVIKLTHTDFTLADGGVITPINPVDFQLAQFLDFGSMYNLSIVAENLGGTSGPTADRLTYVTSAVDALSATPAVLNSTAMNVTAVWSVPTDLGFHLATELTYVVSIVGLGGAGDVNMSKVLTPADYAVIDGQVLPNDAIMVASQQDLTSNAGGFAVSVVAVTNSGASPATTITIALSSSAPTSSGLSNTAIAGIAVGATVGGIALALVVYKIHAARKKANYQELEGKSLGDSDV